MDIKRLIPANKFDNASIPQLQQLSYEEIGPIIPDLLEWLQDMDWPVASEVRDVLVPFNQLIFPELKKIFSTDDAMWKYRIMECFGYVTNDSQFINEMIRIATKPTKIEIADMLPERAIEILESRNIVF